MFSFSKLRDSAPRRGSEQYIFIMKAYARIIFFGLITWLIPFATAFFFYNPKGELRVDIFLFKSIMIIVGSISAAILLVAYFKRVTENYRNEGIRIGIFWFVLNILLDMVLLLPMSGMSLPDYFAQIGLRYIVIPVMTIMVGAALASKENV